MFGFSPLLHSFQSAGAFPRTSFSKTVRLGAALLTTVSPLLLSGCAEGDAEEWTYLVYLHADNNLDRAAVSDIEEMLKAGGDKAKFVVQIDRSPDYGKASLSSLPFEAGVQRLVITDKKLEIVEDLGELDSSDPQTLEDFISWGLSNYDNERVALFYWDHGGGWTGFGHDETDKSGVLDLPEMIEATSNALNGSSRERFDLLGFDACLMGNLEVALSFKNLTDYFLGSEENEPGHGWNYASMKIPLKGGASDPESVGSAIVDGFWDQAKSRGTSTDVTLSLVDTAQLDALAKATHDAFDVLAGAELNGDLAESFNEKQQQNLVRNATEMAQVRHGSVVFGGAGTNLIDLHFLWSELANKNSSYDEVSRALEEALDQAVVHRIQGPYHENTRGLSVYLPPTETVYSSRYSMIDSGGWSDRLEGLYRVGELLRSPGLDFFSQELDVRKGAESGLSVRGRLLGDALASGFSPYDIVTSVRLNIGQREQDDPNLVLLVGSILGSFDNDEGVARGDWHGNHGTLIQGDLKVPVSAYELPSQVGYRTYAAPVQYDATGEGRTSILLTWNVILNEEDGSVLSAAFYRPEVSNLGAPGCANNLGPGCEYYFSEWTPREGSVVYLEDLVYDTSSQSTFRRTRGEAFDPLAPIEVGVEVVEEGAEVFLSLSVIDLLGQVTLLEGDTQL